MMSDTTRKRSTRKPRTGAEAEWRRSRGEAACADCRRLKLRCDRQIPCGSCKRRGFPNDCPHGYTQPVRMSRIEVDASRKISEMSQRIRQLEDALSISHASGSHGRHPLLNDKLLAIKFDPRVQQPIGDPDSGQDESEESVPHLTDALGILSIGEEEVRYYGASAGSEPFLNDGLAEYPDAGAVSSGSSPSYKGPDPIPRPASVEELMDKLPPYERAWALCEAYVEHITWLSRPIKRDELIEDFITPIYKAKHKDRDALQPKYHALAALFFLFACAALFDLTLPPHSDEAHNYFLRGREALLMKSCLSHTELETVQALALFAMYYSYESHRYSIDNAWCVLSLGCKLGQKIGLHRDSKRWNLPQKLMEKRRNLFWEIYIQDLLYSITLGRPTSMYLRYADCEFPTDEDATMNEKGEVVPGFWAARFKRIKVLWALFDSALSDRVPSYKTVLALDQQVRECSAYSPEITSNDTSSMLSCMQQFSMAQWCPLSMIYLHRMHFTHALIYFPKDPLHSPYATSVLAAYHYASSFIKVVAKYSTMCPELLGRHWPTWTNTFTAAVIVGSIVTKATASDIAPMAFIDLCNALNLLEKASQVSARAAAAAPLIRLLKTKALKALGQFRAGVSSEILENDDGLRVFAGHSRILPKKRPEYSERPSPTSSDSINLDCPPSGNEGSLGPTNVYPYSVAESVSTVPEDTLTHMHADPALFFGLLEETSSDAVYGDSPQVNGDAQTMSYPGVNLQPPIMAEEQWMSFLKSFNIIDAETRMEDVIGTGQGNMTGYIDNAVFNL